MRSRHDWQGGRQSATAAAIRLRAWMPAGEAIQCPNVSHKGARRLYGIRLTPFCNCVMTSFDCFFTNR